MGNLLDVLKDHLRGGSGRWATARALGQGDYLATTGLSKEISDLLDIDSLCIHSDSKKPTFHWSPLEKII